MYEAGIISEHTFHPHIPYKFIYVVSNLNSGKGIKSVTRRASICAAVPTIGFVVYLLKVVRGT